MHKLGISVEKDAHVWGEDPNLDGGRPIRFPLKPRSEKAKLSGKTKGIAPDAKRFNDDIPDPDAEETVPE